MKKKDLIVLTLCLIAMATRFVFIVDGQSILPNFTAVAAIAIIASTHFNGQKRWMIPLLLLWISDLILNNVVYADYFSGIQYFSGMWSYLAIIMIGIFAYFLLKRISWMRLGLTATGAAVIFFLVTNFGVWISPATPYAKDISGLMASYEAGLPFFRNTLLGNLFFTFALYGAYDWIATRQKELTPYIYKNLRTQ
jgi:hypothetical protein